MKQSKLFVASKKLFRDFLASEQTGGILLVLCTIVAMAIANSSWAHLYHDLLHTQLWGMSLEHWINDGLMTIFFLLVGLELEREVYLGELRTLRKALLPLVSALGGMAVPAGIYLLFNYGTEFQRGAGIPTATDIAFSLALLSLVSQRVPFGLKVFLASVAIADDLGAILLIATVYSGDLSWSYLLAAGLFFLGLCLANRMQVQSLWFYLPAGIVLWYLVFQSGVHATITGVLLAFAIPFRDGSESSSSYRLQHWLHMPVAFGVLPIFALANTGITLSAQWSQSFFSSCSLGVILGLCLGKPIGIVSAAYLVVLARIGELPTGLTLRHVFGASIAAGIGFTMSIFVTNLAFTDSQTIDACKVAILTSLVLSTVVGIAWFVLFVPKVIKPASDAEQ